MTYLQAAVTILTHTDRPLTVGEVTAIAVAQELIRPRGRTPDRSMSSVLYRRMATDPDAPVTCTDGRFWLRGRAPVTQNATALRPGVRHVRRTAGDPGRSRRQDQSVATQPRPATTLPEPLPLVLPLDALRAVEALENTGRRARAAGRLAERLRRFMATHTSSEEQQAQWDVERTFRTLVTPALTLLGYRRVDQRALDAARGRLSRRLEAGDDQVLLLDVVNAAHVLTDSDARAPLARAVALHARWVLLTNGRAWRLYTPLLADALHDPSGALVLRVDLPETAADTGEQAAYPLWLLTRAAVASGALDAYLESRAVGAALLGALDDPDSALVAALVEAVETTTGLRIASSAITRHARLAVRNERGRDGEPLASAIPAVAAITGAPIAGAPVLSQSA